MNLLEEGHANRRVDLHLHLVEIAQHIYHIVRLVAGIDIQLLAHLLVPSLQSSQQQFLFVTENLVHRTLGYVKSLRDLIHLHSLDATLVKLVHGIVDDSTLQFLAIVVNFTHISCPIYFFDAKIQKKSKNLHFLYSFLLPLHKNNDLCRICIKNVRN